MIKIILSIVFAVAGSLIFVIASTFDIKIYDVNDVVAKYENRIAEVREIDKINKWIREQNFESMNIYEKPYSVAEGDMISFYDLHSSKLNLKIQKYFYTDVDLKMDFNFEYPVKNYNDIYQLLSVKYYGGLIQFKSLKIQEGFAKGTFTLIQPISKEKE